MTTVAYMTIRWIKRVSGLLVAFCFLFVNVESLYAQTSAATGVMDHRNTDFFEDNSFNLIGEWEFYWKELLNPGEFGSQERRYENFPSLWNDMNEVEPFGYASYRLIILLPDSIPQLALSIPDMYTSYRLFADGMIISENGNVDSTKVAYTPQWLPKTVVLPNTNKTTLELVLQIANFDHSKGGISEHITIGNAQSQLRKHENRLSYSYLITGILFMAGFFFLGIYFFGREEKANFYYALFCFLYIYRILGFGTYPLHALLPDLDWILTTKLEYISMYIAVLVFGLYTRNLYPDETNKTLINILIWICSIFTGVVIFLPAKFFTMLVIPFFVVIITYMIYAVWIYSAAVKNHREGSRFALASTGVIFAVFIYTILVYLRVVEDSILINLFGYLSFFCFQSLVLVYRFTSSLKRALLEAQEASTAKSQFLSTMSHEIRTPLNAIIGLSGLQSRTTTDRKSKEFAKTIKRNGENLLRMFNNFIDYSTIISGELILTEEVFNLDNVLNETRATFASEIDHKDLSFYIDLDPEIAELIKADRQRLLQVLINLTDNAMKFTEKGGIRIEVKRNEDKLTAGNLTFRIIDTGIGVDHEKVHKLFERFSQLDSGFSRKYGGTGFGLALCKEIVTELGGTIWHSDNSPEGAIFSFTIKAEEIKEKQTQHDFKLFADGRTTSFKKPKILIAEDNEVNQVVARSVLEKLDLDADVAENGQLVLQRHAEEKYDIIFMDVEMPHMNGIETTKKLRGLDESEHRPIIIALTANALPEDRKRCLDAGMDDFVPKPISLESIRLVLDKWISTI